MVIIATLYAILVWLIFSKLKLIKWGWLSGSIATLIGLAILAVFLGLLNFLTPSGSIVVAGPVMEVTPNVSGQVIAIPVKPNVPVKAGTVLFRIDPAPFQYKVTQLEAALVSAQRRAETLKVNYEQATAHVEGIESQLHFQKQRLSDFQTLVREGADPRFKEQDWVDKVEVTTAQLQVAKAVQLSAKLALDAQIGGVNTAVVQAKAQLDDAKWELEQTAVRAPADGYATVVALTVGDRALQLRSTMSFIIADEIRLIGTFSQNGLETIQPGARVKVVLNGLPGRVFHATITEIPRGVGQGQIAVSGTLARVGSIGGTHDYSVALSIPEGLDRDQLRLGMSGRATVFAEKAGVIGIIADILIWISAYTAYL